VAKLTETEAKLQVPDLDTVKRRIEAAGGTLTAPRVFERNLRFDDDKSSLREAGTVLRLRWDTRARLTYKDGDRQIGQYGSTRFEAEVEVSDFDTMQIILGKLGFHPSFVYEKYRTTYALDGAEVTLDEMPFGSFVEVEGEEDAIGRVVERLELTAAPRFHCSYTLLFNHLTETLDLSFDDLTFENFAGVSVPDGALEGACSR
jgi:adenylate cyclase class 2